MTSPQKKVVSFSDDGDKCCICKKYTTFANPITKSFCCSLACLDDLIPLSGKQEKSKKGDETKGGVTKPSEKRNERKEKEEKRKRKEKMKRKLVDGDSKTPSSSSSSSSIDDTNEEGTGERLSLIRSNMMNEFYVYIGQARDSLSEVMEQEKESEKLSSIVEIRRKLVDQYITLMRKFTLDIGGLIPELTDGIKFVDTSGDVSLIINEKINDDITRITDDLLNFSTRSNNNNNNTTEPNILDNLSRYRRY